jgi:tRNA threonylcarbamoyladenosine biosynthesis protein TsaE
MRPAEPLHLLAPSHEDTRAIGEAVGGLLVAGDVVSLTGDLGAGKTTFVQGAARALQVSQPVLSPTFTLVREYRGLLPVYHLDVYRLERLREVEDLGFDEYLEGEGVVFVEWGDAIERLLPPEHLQVELTLPDETETRRLTLELRGASWERRAGWVAAATMPWRGP